MNKVAIIAVSLIISAILLCRVINLNSDLKKSEEKLKEEIDKQVKSNKAQSEIVNMLIAQNEKINDIKGRLNDITKNPVYDNVCSDSIGVSEINKYANPRIIAH